VSQPTREQWDQLRQELRSIYGTGYLHCDDYLVSLQWERVAKGRQTYALAVYVDGWIKGEWMVFGKDEDAEIPDIPRRFYRPSKRQRYPSKDIKQMEKILGKRRTKAWGYYDKKLSCMPYWNTLDTCIRHLVKHNQGIEILTHEAYEAALEAKRQAA
jgi:hypothetical protein